MHTNLLISALTLPKHLRTCLSPFSHSPQTLSWSLPSPQTSDCPAVLPFSPPSSGNTFKPSYTNYLIFQPSGLEIDMGVRLSYNTFFLYLRVIVPSHPPEVPLPPIVWEPSSFTYIFLPHLPPLPLHQFLLNLSNSTFTIKNLPITLPWPFSSYQSTSPFCFQ